MKKTIIILMVILISSGCVASKKGPLGLEPEKIPGCPELIKVSANNLEQIGIDHTKVEKWKDSSLKMTLQPCRLCQKLNKALYVLRDENGTYKDAMIKLIQAVEKYDPNAAPPTNKQTKEVGNALINSGQMDNQTLAGQYIIALEDLQMFLIGEIHLTSTEARNFALDKFFIPLLKP